MNRARLILVFGISGVGKTTACIAFANTNPDYVYRRASSILEDVLNAPAEALRRATPEAVIAHQAVLPSALNAIRLADPRRTVLLDSHAVVDNDVTLVTVPLELVAALEPDGFVLLEANAETVKQRREQGTRNRPERSTREIRAEAAAERRAVYSYAQALDKPLVSDAVVPGYDLRSAIDKLRTGRRI